MRPMEEASWRAQQAAEAEVVAAFDTGNIAHEREVLSHHGGVPSEAAAIALGITPSSGAGSYVDKQPI